MRISKISKNPYLIFLPFLIFFIVFILIFHTDKMEGDEGRYLMFAQNLLHGFYSPHPPDINLWNGPGYPIILVPFVALHLPLICITLLNAVFYYLSIVLLFKALQKIVMSRKAFLFSLFWACFYNSYQKMPRILTETLTLFLVSLLVYFLVEAFSNKSNKYLFMSGIVMGYIVLTKIIFGYVLLIMLVGSGLLWIINLKAINYKKGFLIMLIAFATTTPYLIYTYQLTGRLFYWGNSGGISLYWMSTPIKGEYGDFLSGDLPEWHKKNLSLFDKYVGVEQDNVIKEVAFNNIKEHPLKYAQNWIANLGRLFFNFPYTPLYDSYNEVGNPYRTLLMLPINVIVFLLTIFSFFMTIIHWRYTKYYIRFLFCFVFLYLGASSFVSAYSRQFYIIVPLLIFWFAYIINKSMVISIKFDNNV